MYDDLVTSIRESTCHFDACGMCPKRDATCIDRLALQATDAIKELSKRVDESIPKDDAEIIIAEVAKPRWIPVTERMPETGVDVLVKFPQNMAVASIDIGEWVVNSGDGWCTDINLAGGEKNPTYWMPLPQPPEEEK